MANLSCYPTSDNETSISNHGQNNAELMQSISVLNKIAYSYLMPALLVTGILSNLANITCLHNLGGSRHKKQQRSTTTYMYLYWLAVAQLLACLSVIPSLVHLDRRCLNYYWAFYYAHFEITAMNSFTSTCVYIVVGLSVDRFVAVCRPHTYHVMKGVRLALIRIVACFVVPPIIYSPLCFFQKVELNEMETGYVPSDNIELTSKFFWQFWNAGVELCHRLIPALFVVIMNICIIIQYKKVKSSVKVKHKPPSSKREPTNEQLSETEPRKGKTDQESKMFLLLMGVIVVFLFSTLPAACLGLTDSFGHGYQSFQFEIFRAVANLLEILGFSVNFFLYFFLVPEVKEKFYSTFTNCSKSVNSGNRRTQI